VFANTDPAPPTIKIVDRNVSKTVVSDADLISSYRSALAAWIIVFIILLVATIFIGYLVRKGRSILGSEQKELDKIETVFNSKKAEIEEQKVLLTAGSKNGKAPPTMKAN
jgi:hypothetical protein